MPQVLTAKLSTSEPLAGMQEVYLDEVYQKFSAFRLPEQRVSISNPGQLPPFCRKEIAVVAAFRMNDAGYINKTLEAFNLNMEEGTYLLGCFETFTARRARKSMYQVPVFRYVLLLWEFVFLRVLPRIQGINKIYFLFSRGKDRLLSKAEMLGRLVCCGFEILDYQPYQGLIWFLVKKKTSPKFDLNASYGPVFAMPRIGKNGKTIYVYKLRTMHPYSEYLQDFIVKRSGYGNNGKPANDFRLTPWGKVLRKYWIDELPQLINLLKGDLKWVGVRPVSKRYFEDIPADLQAMRLKQKPGCIPPYLALNMPSDVKNVQAAERIYLTEKEQRPLSTDWRYFRMALINILMRKKRSA